VKSVSNFGLPNFWTRRRVGTMLEIHRLLKLHGFLYLLFTGVVGVILCKYVSFPFFYGATVQNDSNQWQMPSGWSWTGMVDSFVILAYLLLIVCASFWTRLTKERRKQVWIFSTAFLCTSSLTMAVVHLLLSERTLNPYEVSAQKSAAVDMILISWCVLLYNSWLVVLAMTQKEPPPKDKSQNQ